MFEGVGVWVRALAGLIVILELHNIYKFRNWFFLLWVKIYLWKMLSF